MNILAHNLMAMNADRMVGNCIGAQTKSMEKLSSGYKINRAADDAAGLSISEKMRKQIRGLSQATQNAQDGISMVQIADGALTEVHDMLQRGNELMIKAANGTLSASDRADIQLEVRQLTEAIDQIAANTKFNELQLFPTDGANPALAGSATINRYELSFDENGVSGIVHTLKGEGVGSSKAVNTGNALADKIAKEYVPNAINQILNKFGSLKDIIDSAYTGDAADKLKMDLSIKYVDGSGGTLAYVEGRFYNSTQTLSGMSLLVDSADFSEEDVKNNSSKMGKLESTIAHEMMHAVVDAALPARMYQNGGAEDFPLWFSEGIAQLAGGGFTTGWNDELKAIGDSVNKISEYLKKYKINSTMTENDPVQNRVYGHGYLAAAYMGYIADNNAGNVTAEKIARGMNKIFKNLADNPSKSLEEVFNTMVYDIFPESEASKHTFQQVMYDINNGTSAAVDFVRGLMNQVSTDGAGSVIASGGLGASAGDVLGDSETSSKIYIDMENIYIESLNDAAGVTIQAGADNDSTNRITMKMFRMSSRDLGLDKIENTSAKGIKSGEGNVVNALTMKEATNGIDIFKNAINLVSGVRSYYGAVQNRMEHTIRNLDNIVENTTSSESKLRDTDMASEMVKLSMQNILVQAGQSMLTQANQSNQGLLALL